MGGDRTGRTFISYSRKDDSAAFADGLRAWLEKENLSVWQDIVALEGGRDWWSQIEDTLRSKELQHFILVVTPAALASPYVRQEIRLARQEGKTVCPVKGPGLHGLKHRAALDRPYLQPRSCRAENGVRPLASGREPAEARADDGAGAAGGFR